MKNIVAIVTCLSVAALTSCASKPEDIEASYVSPALYNSYSCDELSEEARKVSALAARASGVQRKKASQDAVATGVAVVLFWPAAFLVKGDGSTSAEVANLKGQMQALEAANTKKKCGLKFQAA